MDPNSFNLLIFSAAIGFSAIAAYFDLKTGEIPDKFTLGLVVVALAMRAAFSLYSQDFNYLFDGALVGALFFGFGAVLFYTGGWGGGDAKLMAGIGTSLGGWIAPSIADSSLSLFPQFFGFFAAISIIAIPYSLIYALILSFKSPKVFKLARERIIKNWFILCLAVLASASMMILLPPWNLMLTIALLFPPVFYFLIIFTRTVEEVAMQKEVRLSELKEGDMVAEDLIINGKKLASRRDMDGLSKESLKKIRAAKGGPKTVRIKWGIKFAPAFPLALAICPFWTGIMGLLL